ncbi:MAG: hypothetical protein ABI648_10875 [Betaproteobacteria bacterium]
MRVSPQLEKILRRLVSSDAQELWLLSGVGAFAKHDDRTVTLRIDALDAESVWALHRECLGLAGRSDLQKLLRAHYTTTVPNLGALQCEFVCRGGTANLPLSREAEGVEVMSGTGLKPLRPLTARATPNRPVNPDAPKAARRLRTSR